MISRAIHPVVFHDAKISADFAIPDKHRTRPNHRPEAQSKIALPTIHADHQSPDHQNQPSRESSAPPYTSHDRDPACQARPCDPRIPFPTPYQIPNAHAQPVDYKTNFKNVHRGHPPAPGPKSPSPPHRDDRSPRRQLRPPTDSRISRTSSHSSITFS